LATGAERIRIYVASPEQEQAARDITRHIAKPAEIELDIRTVKGTPEALVRLHEAGTLQFALLQSDAADAYLRAVRRGSANARMMIEQVGVIVPLHEEEIHFVVRRDSPMNSLQDLAEARVNLGPLHSGSALTAMNIYRLVFDAAIPEAQASFLPHEDALLKLITEQNIDAVAIVAPRPVKLLANMKPEARQFVKLLKFDALHPSVSSLLNVYSATTATAEYYPNLLEIDQPILSVKINLVASGQGKRSEALLARFATVWCKNHERLRVTGIPPAETSGSSLLKLTAGWSYAPPVERVFNECSRGEKPSPEPCVQEYRILGLCE
jgi:TRAP-type uncharacterized transport system substrate-binding protein